MTQEKEKEKLKPVPPEDGATPIEEGSLNEEGEGEGADPGDDLKKEAEKAKDELEKRRERFRQMASKVEGEDTEASTQHKLTEGQ